MNIKGEHLIVSVLLILLAVMLPVATAQINLLQIPDTFSDNYGENWEENGSLNGLTITADNALTPNNGQGYYVSDQKNYPNIIEMDSIRLDSELTVAGNESSLEIWTTEDGGRIQTQTIQLIDGDRYYQIEGFNESATGYRFNLTVEDNEEINSITVNGASSEQGEQKGVVVFVLQFLLVFLAAAIPFLG